MDGAARATLIGTVIAAVVSLVGAFLARYGKRDDTATERQRLAEDARQKDLDRLYTGLREMIAGLQAETKECRDSIDQHEATIGELRLENHDLRGDRAQLGNEVKRLTTRVAELEGKVSGGDR